MKKIGKKKYVVILIFCFILTAVILFIGYGVPIIGRSSYTEEKTHEYTAIFKLKEKDNENYILYLNDHTCTLIFNSNAIINEKRFNNLDNGEKITFRSLFDFEALSERECSVEILSLNTEDAEIITLESSKTAVTNSDIKIKITSTVFAVIFLIGAVVCVLYLAGVFPIKKKNQD